MKPFATIAIPHRDILEGKLTMDVFAADLWEVFQGRAPDEYQDPVTFFRKTYVTDGLRNLLYIAEKRLKGMGGDPIIQLQTPFGGGKTHSLIALYHKAREWKVNTVVIDGTALDPKEDILWEEIERQLTGQVKILKGNTSPGREKLRKLFEEYQPLLILMDEILQYTTKAAGIKVGESNLAAQVKAFIHELTGTIKTFDKALLILTLPSSVLEHYDETAERLFHQLQKIVGRMEKVYTPVRDEEVAHVIRRRLFSSVDENEARKVIEGFIDYAEKEGILPEGMEKSTYRERFMASYPFQPEVIDVLYKRWGSFTSFQRTRGVLRLLSLVVYSLKDSRNSYIRLADFDLGNDEIRRELVRHIGSQYDSIIAQDITSEDAGAKKVDRKLGNAYRPYCFGTAVATSIFMYSHSGGPERGATINEIKLTSCYPPVPTSIIVEAIDKLKEQLFYLSDEGLYFTNMANLNRIRLDKMESITEIEPEERNLLVSNLTEQYFNVFIWPRDTKDVPDTKTLKLVVLRDCEQSMKYMEDYGERPRVYRNAMIFLCPKESERIKFESLLKTRLAWQLIDKDEKLHLTDTQRKEVKDRLHKAEDNVKQGIRELYRIVLVPTKDGFKEFDLGISTFGTTRTIDREVYERLKTEGELQERLAPLVIKEKYLKDKDYVGTRDILEMFFNTPGEIRIVSDVVFKNCIREGVKQGLFGIGNLENGNPVCRQFKDDCTPELIEGEILIKPELCETQPTMISDERLQLYVKKIRAAKTKEELGKVMEEVGYFVLSEHQKEIIESERNKKLEELRAPAVHEERYQQIRLKLNVPTGKLSNIVRMVAFLQRKFNQVGVKVEISTDEGEITVSEYENNIKETIRQIEANVEEEEIY